MLEMNYKISQLVEKGIHVRTMYMNLVFMKIDDGYGMLPEYNRFPNVEVLIIYSPRVEGGGWYEST